MARLGGPGALRPSPIGVRVIIIASVRAGEGVKTSEPSPLSLSLSLSLSLARSLARSQFALGKAFEREGARHAILLEEDMLLSPDFLALFEVAPLRPGPANESDRIPPASGFRL